MAEGLREPGFNEAQKKFNMVFVLVTAPGQFPPPEEDLNKLDAIRQQFPSHFNDWTLGRGAMDTNLSTLEPPTNLRITNTIHDRSFLNCEKICELAWDPYLNNELQGFNIYCSSHSKGTFSKLCGPVSGNTCRVGGLDCRKNYLFHITAVLSSGEESTFSNLTRE